jgi:hypothetical protein
VFAPERGENYEEVAGGCRRLQEVAGSCYLYIPEDRTLQLVVLFLTHLEYS